MVADDGLIRAAGVVLRRPDGRIAVVHRPRRQDWSLPKGKLERGESYPVAAVRECHEETGVRVALGLRLPDRAYEVEGVPKYVRYWRADAVSTDPFRPDDEVDDLRWVEPVDAPGLLSYPDDVALVTAAVAVPRTKPLVVLRHAEASKRVAWQASGAGAAADDMARPLAPAGLVQADAVATVLEAYGITRVVTSPARRCRQTVEPYAALVGVRVTTEHLLSEEGHEADPEGTDRTLRRLLAEHAEPTVVCTHRPVLPAVLAVFGAGARAPGSDELDPRLPPAAMLVLHRDETGAVLGVERVDV